MESINHALSIPLILFSGMGADESIFASQKLAFPNLIVPEWISPLPKETLGDYCQRIAKEIDPGTPCFVGGASFGGIVALEITRHLDAIACFLIGSVSSPSHLPKRIMMARPMGGWLQFLPIRLLQRSAAASNQIAKRSGAKHLAGISRQFSEADSSVLRWSALQMLRWNSDYEDVLVRHIHGDRDHVFPIGCVEPDEVVVGGGHVISMTHGSQVNDFLRRQICELADSKSD